MAMEELDDDVEVDVDVDVDVDAGVQDLDVTTVEQLQRSKSPPECRTDSRRSVKLPQRYQRGDGKGLARHATLLEKPNGMTSLRSSTNASGYKHVYRHGMGFIARVSKGGVRTYLGVFERAVDAAVAVAEFLQQHTSVTKEGQAWEDEE
eukprot:CAMPEP_0119316608 /NCGR_PEP_ID=MMETSP1333-20130426/40170_1 /TAXON_ID=418940 /ORGANISM="Scyphosphaera apsteinii, Strain RCC1455" /LENGTH=148 /DNA_ID=CAMNT_0007322297 /DNA_START=20 /DNA_END=463 /DNA_ORIENTATION=-